MDLVTVQDVVERLDPRPPTETNGRIEVLIGDAERVIRRAFLKQGADLDQKMAEVPWLQDEVEDVIREMVSAAIIIGPNAGVRSVASSTGQESDQITYADVDSVRYSGVRLTDQMKSDLGLNIGALPRGRFPRGVRWPEVVRRG